MEELQVNLENATLENQTLCKELAELTGDDVRPRELINNSSKVSERSNTPPQPPGGGKNAAIAPRSSTEQSSTSAHSAAAAAKGLNMAVHREGIEVELTALQKLVRSLGKFALKNVLLFLCCGLYRIAIRFFRENHGVGAWFHSFW